MEFSIRNKAKQPIMTIKPKVLAMMFVARPESVALVLHKKTKDYQRLTGHPLTLDYDQSQELLLHAGADAQGIWHSRYAQLPGQLFKVVTLFSDGFLNASLSGSIIADLATVEAFYAMVDRAIDL